MPLVLDAGALIEAAAEHGMHLPRDYRPCYVRFKPGTRCLVAYGKPESRGAPLFYASAFGRGSAKLAKALERRSVGTESGPGRIVISGSAVEVCVFPNDDHLKALIALENPGKKKDVLAKMFAREMPELDATLERLAYKPERRCVFKHVAGNGSTSVIKAYTRTGFGAARDRARHFCASPRIEGAQRLLGANERYRLLAMSWLPGRSLADELRGESPDTAHFRRAGEMLALVHSSDPAGLPLWCAAAASNRLDEVADVMAVLHPDEAARTRSLARRVSAAIARSDERVTLHGDFHTRQAVFEDDRSGIIDFDEALDGPAALDLGFFSSRVRMNAARAEVSEAVASSVEEALLDGYASRRPLPSAQSLGAHTAFAFLAVAHEPFRRHRANWPREISEILDRVEHSLTAMA